MACLLDFSFITDDCRFDNGALRTSLEDLCDLASQPIVITDPNAGDCGEYGDDSTIENIEYDTVTRELKVHAQPAWGAYLISQIDDTDFGGTPQDISSVGLYAGATVPFTFTNPSDCRNCVVVMTVYQSDSVIEGDGGEYAHQVRDITGGTPGVNIGDRYSKFVGASFDGDNLNTVPLTNVLAPSATWTIDLQSYIEVFIAAPGSEWNQSILDVRGIAVLV